MTSAETPEEFDESCIAVKTSEVNVSAEGFAGFYLLLRF